MNYAQYLQNGGSAEPRQFSEEEIAMIKTLQPYGEAFKQSPGGAIEMAARELNFNLDSPAEIREFLTGLDAYAKLINDVDLINDIQKFGQESNLVAEEPMFKCGGRVRAKVKKASCGKKLEKGAKVPVEKKGGCPCQYKKIGGHIKLVDCNGIPVAKNGNVLKFQSPAGQLPKINTQLDINPNLLGGSAYRSQYLWGNGGSKTTVNPTSVQNQTMPKSKLDSYQNLTGDEAYRLMHGTAPEVIEQERLAAAEAAASAQPAKQTWRQMFDAGKVKYGGLTKEEALARQKEMQAAKGFNVDLGKWGADGMWGNQSKAEWERYQAWKQQQAQPTMSMDEKFVRELETSGRPIQDAEYANMDASQAIHLKDPIAYQRWMDLQFGNVQPVAYKTNRVVLNANAPRKDIYNYATATAPFAQVNPIAAARKDGGKMSYADYLK